ncbi:EAL domain-containing protein [Aquabacterium sp. A7-Y]|uniref:EAL domain-containing protein n=1 Tax=Aquabacterium sp. A7-Y TaxID=1349605 RepID=UPI00223D5A94|nr:EAL domain-containing protein [Aquabacterium sp. A7-Y]MCW7537377.1 EAL domain-containing protein [Aquabacterium sp. A7-Y]
MLASTVSIVGLWAAALLWVDGNRRSAVQFAYLQADSAADKLAERTARLLERVDQTATMVKYLQERDGVVDLHRLERDHLFLDQAAAPTVHLVNELGRVFSSTGPLPDVWLDDRQYFLEARRNPGAALFVSPPVQSRVRHTWVMPSSKGLLRGDGSFAGAVVVVFDPLFLTRGFTIKGHPQALVGVIGRDSIYRARSADGHHSVGDRLPPGSVEFALSPEGRPPAPVVSTIDGVPRFHSVVPVGKHDLYVVVAVPESTTLAEFRVARGRIFTAAFICTLLILASAVFLTRQARLTARRTDEKRQAEQDLFREKELLAVTLRSIADGVVTTDARGRLTYLNPAAEVMTGWPVGQAAGREAAEVVRIVDAAGQPLPADPLVHAMASRTASAGHEDNAIQSRSGVRRPIEHSAAPIFGGEGQLWGAVMVMHDVSRTRQLAHELSYQASHDPLTDLLNRTAFDERLDAAIAKAERQGRQHVLMFLDLDQFKVVNDSCGHIAGDALLKQLSQVLGRQVRKDDTLARLGGDEFGVLLEDCPLPSALRVAEDLRQQVSELQFVWQGKVFRIGVSIGIVAILDGRHSRSDLLRMADTACYLAKDHGRNRLHVYDDTDQSVVQRQGEIDWVSKLQNALSEDRLFLEGQRIESLTEGQGGSMSYEILVRLRDENGRVVPPMAFLPAAERYGLMTGIDKWVIDKALELHARCAREFGQRLKFSINLSGVTMCDPTIADYVTDKIRQYQVEPSAICFEVTETAAIANLPLAIEFIACLRRLGCRFALDDFGSGMSSFGYLKQLPVDYVKIDGSFVKEMLQDPVDYAMVEAINTIAHRMGLKTVAEFVENQELIDALRVMGVDFVQGYGVERPKSLVPA